MSLANRVVFPILTVLLLPLSAQADCAATAAEKKLAGAAKASFMKKCAANQTAQTAAAPAPSAAGCADRATEKRLAGAAKASFMKKCEADSAKPVAQPVKP